jgi:alanyl-tRNA synthetase
MTKTNFLNDSNTLNFEAVITAVNTDEEGCWVELDQTYFYPEGGGQPCDLGTISTVSVIDVQYRFESIYHLLATPLITGTPVLCEVDPARRIDMMQQHTGQHLLSHGLEHLFDAATIGFHLTENNLTVDAGKKLCADDMTALETYTNDLIRQDLKVIIHYPDPLALDLMPLRKKPKVTEAIRIIEIEGKDFSPCGGTHLKAIGPIQLIKIKRFEHYKSGTRIEFVCGGRALGDYAEKNATILTLSSLLSSAPDGLIDAVTRLKSENDVLHKELMVLKERQLKVELAEAIDTRGKRSYGDLAVFETTDLDPQLFRKASALMTSQVKGVSLLINTIGDTYQLILAQSDDKPYDLQSLFAQLKASYCVKGGGSPVALQGGGTKTDIVAVKAYLLENL